LHENHLNIAGQREVASLGMSLETVVSEDASQVGMVGEEDAVHVPNLSLVPVGSLVDLVARVNRRQLVGVGLDADSRVVAQRKEIVDDLEAVGTRWDVHAGDVDEILELRLVMILEELQHGKDAFGGDEDLQLVAGSQLNLLDVARQVLGDVFAEVCEICTLNGVELADSRWNRNKLLLPSIDHDINSRLVSSTGADSLLKRRAVDKIPEKTKPKQNSIFAIFTIFPRSTAVLYQSTAQPAREASQD
jgi:hypothetical protein